MSVSIAARISSAVAMLGRLPPALAHWASLYEANCNYAPRVEVHSRALGAGPLNDSTANGVVALTGGTAERP